MILKRCACCGDKHQTNVVALWKRNSDGVIFHICAYCAEKGFKPEDLKAITKKTYTTIKY